jgi:hypothetical protein
MIHVRVHVIRSVSSRQCRPRTGILIPEPLRRPVEPKGDDDKVDSVL